MAIKNVTANVNGTSYDLLSAENDNYSADIEAPKKAAEYGISVTATDEAGNATTIDSTDKQFGESLKLKARDTLETADLRHVILTNELGDRMLDTVAPIYDLSSLTLYVFEAFGETLTKETDFVAGDFILQMFPQTVTWGIPLWEDEYGILPDASKTIEQRRQYLMNAISKHSSITPKRVEDIVYAVTGFRSTVTENTAPNTISIYIYAYVKNLQPLKSELDSKLPAHIAYTISTADQETVNASATYSGFGIQEVEKVKVEVMN